MYGDIQIELYHHGIKGMKWGIRRFQNKNGSLTALGRKRYSDESDINSSNSKTKTKIKRYDKLYSKYKDQGCDDEEARRMAKGQIKTERVLMAIGGVAAATAIAYTAYRIRDNMADTVISPFQSMQTVHTEDASKRLARGNPFYASFTKTDNNIYASTLFTHFGKDSNVTKFYTNDGIKVASRNSGKKVFYELIDNDSSFKKYVKESFRVTSDKELKTTKMYNNFNKCLVFRDKESDKFNGKFYSALSKKGYGAVIDAKNSKTEGWTFKPVIVFDSQKKYIISSTKATDAELGVKRLLKASILSSTRELLTHPLESPVVRGLAITGGGSLVVSSIKASKFVKDYKAEHPNTKLTDFQITSMYLNDKKD